MPQLAENQVKDWLAAYEPAAIAGWAELIRPVEQADAAEASLTELGEALDEALRNGSLVPLTKTGLGRDDLRAVLAQLGVARFLRLLRWLGRESGADGMNVLAAQLDGCQAGDPFPGIIQALHRQALLARMFDEARLRALLTASKLAEESAP